MFDTCIVTDNFPDHIAQVIKYPKYVGEYRYCLYAHFVDNGDTATVIAWYRSASEACGNARELFLAWLNGRVSFHTADLSASILSEKGVA